MTTTPAAWHPDPSGRHELRYWNGTAWTEHVSDAGVTGIDIPSSGSGVATAETTAGTTAAADPSAAATSTPPADDPTAEVSAPGFGSRPVSAAPSTGAAGAAATGAAAATGPAAAPTSPYASAPPPEFPNPAPPAGPPRNRMLGWVCIGAAALVFISTFLSYRTFEFASYTEKGTDVGLGKFNIILAALVAGLALWQVVSNANVAAKVLVIVAGAAMLLLNGVFVLAKKATVEGSGVEFPYTPNAGAYLALVGAVIIVLAGSFMKSRQIPKR